MKNSSPRHGAAITVRRHLPVDDRRIPSPQCGVFRRPQGWTALGQETTAACASFRFEGMAYVCLRAVQEQHRRGRVSTGRRRQGAQRQPECTTPSSSPACVSSPVARRHGVLAHRTCHAVSNEHAGRYATLMLASNPHPIARRMVISAPNAPAAMDFKVSTSRGHDTGPKPISGAPGSRAWQAAR